MSFNIIDIIYEVAAIMVGISYLFIARAWFSLGPEFTHVMTPLSMRRLISLMLSLDAMTYFLDVGERYSSVFSRVNLLARVAVAVVAVITASVVVHRMRILRTGRVT